MTAAMRSPKVAHAPKLDLQSALKSPTMTRARPHAIIDARVWVSEATALKDGKSRYDDCVEMLIEATKSEPLSSWIAIQRVSYSERLKPNNHLAELQDFVKAKDSDNKTWRGRVPPAGIVVYAGLCCGAEQVISHIESLPKALRVLGVSYDLDGAPEGTILQAPFVGALRALAARRMPVDISVWGAQGGVKALDEIIELLGALDNEPEPLKIVISGLSDPASIEEKSLDAASYLRSLSQLGLRPNVYLSLASLPHNRPSKPLLQSALEVFGASRILFGSGSRGTSADRYKSHIEAVLQALQDLGASQEDIDLVFAGTTKALYGV